MIQDSSPGACGKHSVFVTGASGYIGSILCQRLLAQGYHVIAFDTAPNPLPAHERLHCVHGDVRRRSDIDRALPTKAFAVVHLAAIVGDSPCREDPVAADQVNRGGLALISRFARQRGVRRFLFASTCSVYGASDPQIPVDETAPLNPLSLYAETKRDGEAMVLEAGKHMAPSILRFATAFGLSHRTRFDLLLNSLTFEAYNHREIQVFAPESWRPYIDVKDIAGAVLHMLSLPEEASAGIFNGGDNSLNYRKEEVAAMVASIVGHVTIETRTDRRDVRTYRVDFSRIEDLGFNATVRLEDGVKSLCGAIQSGRIDRRSYRARSLTSPWAAFPDQGQKETRKDTERETLRETSQDYSASRSDR